MNKASLFGMCVMAFSIISGLAADAEWTFITYLQVDNNLWNYAYYNIIDMQTGIVDTPQVNVLIQWDQPNTNRTWRYKIIKGGKIEIDSVSQEMGINPQQELIDCATWIKTKYPAKKYAWVLSNHGSGIEDRFTRSVINNTQLKNSWIELPGYQTNEQGKGILYDYIQNTYLSSQGLYNAFSKIKTILGQKISLLGIDACLMAMIEVAYQIKDAVEIFVGSQQAEPAYGWAYASIMNALTTLPSLISALQLGQIAVTAYNYMYKQFGETDYTQSAISVADLQPIKENIDEMFNKVLECKKYNSTAIKSAILTARNGSVCFYTTSYIDLYSFYNKFLTQIQKLKSAKNVDFINYEEDSSTQIKAEKKPTEKPTPKFIAALTSLESTLKIGITKILDSIKANAVGSADKGATGLSIYYPHPKYAATQIASNYKSTVFAKQSKWLQFITENRTAA